MYKCAKTEVLLATGKGLRRRMDEDTGILEAVDVVDVVTRSVIMSAAKEGHLLSCWKVFSLHFDWCGILYIQHHDFSLLLANLQAYLLFKSAKTERLLLHVLMGM